MKTLEDRLTQASDEARLQVNQIDTRSVASISTRLQRRRALAGTVAVAAMFIAIGAGALVISNGEGQDAASETIAPSTTVAPNDSSAAETSAADSGAAMTDVTHFVSAIKASSELSAEFGAGMLIDGDLERGWQDASLRGVGAEIVIEFKEPVIITEIIVHPYTSEERFRRNYWVQGYEVRTNDLAGPIGGSFTNEPQPQVIQLNTNETFTLTFTVLTSHPAEPIGDGPPFDELAIAEIQIFGIAATDSLAATDESLAATTTTSIWPVGDSDWDQAVLDTGGVPITDSELVSAGLHPETFKSGSGYRMASAMQTTPVTAETGTVAFTTSTLGADGTEDHIAYCVSNHATLGGIIVSDGAVCWTTLEVALESLSFGLTGSMSGGEGAAQVRQAVLWGVPSATGTVEFQLDDGQVLSVPVADTGTAHLVWTDNRFVESITFDGMTEHHASTIEDMLPNM